MPKVINFEGKDTLAKKDKTMTLGEFRKLTAEADASTELFISIYINGDSGYFPVEDLKTDTEPMLLLCGEEVIMLIEEED